MTEPRRAEERSETLRGAAAEQVSREADGLVDASASSIDSDSELRRLRQRAYGPHPDIEDDPVSLVRLAELEAAHNRRLSSAVAPEVEPADADAPAPPPHPAHPAEPVVGDATPSVTVRRPTKARPLHLLAVGVGAAIVTAVVIAIAMPAAERRPDATLLPSEAEPDDALISLLEAEGSDILLDRSALRGASEMEIDLSTLRGFGTYGALEVWAATNVFASPCLMAVHREAMDVVARACVPSGATLFIDAQGRGLADGERMRFVQRGDTVDAYFLAPGVAD